jgi:hypothetical protein
MSKKKETRRCQRQQQRFRRQLQRNWDVTGMADGTVNSILQGVVS